MAASSLTTANSFTSGTEVAKEKELVWQPDALPDEAPRHGVQAEFLESDADITAIDGGKGSGKTDLLVIDCMRPEKLTSERWKGVIFRREYKRLLEIIDRATYYFGKFPEFKAHWQGDQSRFIFPSGAWLAFHNCENVGDEQKYQGWEICDLKFDQVEEFEMKQVDFLMLQNRSADPNIPATTMWTANPLGLSHAEYKKRYVDGKRPGVNYTTVVEVQNPAYPGAVIRKEYVFKRIFATVFDNPYFRRYPDYIARLAAHPDPVMVKAMLQGDWDVILGQFFASYSSLVHKLVPDKDGKYPIDLPPEYRRMAGCDYGNVKVIEFIARDYRSNVYCEWEYRSAPNQMNTSGETASQFGANSAKFMLDRGIGEGLIVIGDQNMWNRTALDLGSQLIPAMLVQAEWSRAFEKVGKSPPVLVKAVKRGSEEYYWRVACNEAIKNALQYETDAEGKVTKFPTVYFLDRCQSIVVTVPQLRTSEKDKMDYEQSDNVDDHDFEAFKMVFMTIQRSKEAAQAMTAAQRFALGIRTDVPEKPHMAGVVDWRCDF